MSVDLSNIHSLSDFQRNTRSHLAKLKRTGKPTVLTVNGQAELVVQSASAYQKLLEDQELLRSMQTISRSLEQVKRGQGRPMRELLKTLASEHGISLK
jgi:PHD/YefM family antitoxin component YafN of YafNO toxin-antitoxin module